MGRGGGPSGPGGAPSVLPPLEPVAGGFVATVRSSGSLSSMGRDHGSIGSDRESVLRSLCRSWVGVEAEEAMSRNLLRRRGFVPHHDRTPPYQCPVAFALPSPQWPRGTRGRVRKIAELPRIVSGPPTSAVFLRPLAGFVRAAYSLALRTLNILAMFQHIQQTKMRQTIRKLECRLDVRLIGCLILNGTIRKMGSRDLFPAGVL